MSYIGDTQQGPYEGAFVFTSTKDALSGSEGAKVRAQVDAIVSAAGLDPKQMQPIDNSCPDDAVKAGASACGGDTRNDACRLTIGERKCIPKPWIGARQRAD